MVFSIMQFDFMSTRARTFFALALISLVASFCEAAEPSTPEIFVDHVTSHSITVNWNVAENGGSPITNYALQYSRVLSSGKVRSHDVDVGTATSWTLKTAARDASFKFKVQASNADGDSDWSDVVEGTLSEDDVFCKTVDPIVADAGEEQLVKFGNAVTLERGDTEGGDPLSTQYRWSFANTPLGSFLDERDIQGSDGDVAHFMPDKQGLYVLQLHVSDECDFDDAFVRILVVCNDPPTVDAGPHAILDVYVLRDVQLNGYVTVDQSYYADPVTVQWQVVSAPTGSWSATIEDPRALSTKFRGDVSGVYVLRLTASNYCDTVSDKILIDVKDPIIVPEEESDDDEIPVIHDVCWGNALPIASIDTESQEGQVLKIVTLDGSASVDYDKNDELSYSWTVFTKPKTSRLRQASLTGLHSPVVQFKPDVRGYFKLRLDVQDNCGYTDTAFAEVVVTSGAAELVDCTSDEAPKANAGPDLDTRAGYNTEVDGSRSFDDSDSSRLMHSWSFSRVPEYSDRVDADIRGRFDEVASFYPDVLGKFVLKLKVCDECSCDEDEVTVIACNEKSCLEPGAANRERCDSNTPPKANAGRHISRANLNSVDLDGSGSSDADWDALKYSWSFASVPAESKLGASDIVDADKAQAKFTPDVEGEFVLVLYVSDYCMTQSDRTTVRIVCNNKPTANAGPRQELEGPNVVVDLDASSSTAGDEEDDLTYSWSVIRKPQGSTITDADITNSTAVKASFVPDISGSYDVKLVVSDGCSTDETVLQTSVYCKDAPTADAGTVATPTVGANQLNGTVTKNANQPNVTLSYKWVLTKRPYTSQASDKSFSDTGALNATFNADIKGEYILTLKVTDGCSIVESDLVLDATCDSNLHTIAIDAGDTQDCAASAECSITGAIDATYNGNATEVKYEYEFVHIPPGSSPPELKNGTTASPAFTPEEPGLYVLAMTVSDGCESQRDYVPITVCESEMFVAGACAAAVLEHRCHLGPPTADLGSLSLEAPRVGAVVTLDASSISDPDVDDPIVLKWVFKSKPSSSKLEDLHIDGRYNKIASFQPDVRGFYSVALEASDLCGAAGNVPASRLRRLSKASTSSASRRRMADLTPTVFNTEIDLEVGALKGDAPCDYSARINHPTASVAESQVSTPIAPGTINATVTLDGTGSTDVVVEGVNATELLYQWTFQTLPKRSALTDSDITDRDTSLASFSPDVIGVYVVRLEVSDECSTDMATVTVTASIHCDHNTTPVLAAELVGGDTYSIGQTVYINSTGTTDSDSFDADNLAYTWSVQSKPEDSLLSDIKIFQNGTITELIPDAVGSYSILLNVTDYCEAVSKVFNFTVTYNCTGNEAPTARISRQTGANIINSKIKLDASRSKDPEGLELTYAWTYDVETSADPALNTSYASSGAEGFFMATIPGSYNWTLTVTDQCGETATTSSAIEVAADCDRNFPPVVTAATESGTSDFSFEAGSATATIAFVSNATDSDSYDANTLATQWSIFSQPEGANASISGDASSASLTADKQGAYVVEFEVKDSCTTKTKQVTVNVDIDCAVNEAPVPAFATPEGEVHGGDEVTLDASTSTDANAYDALTYAWSIDSKPARSGAALGDAAAQSTNFTADMVGDYTVTLVVSDSCTSTNTSKTITVGANCTSNNAPSVVLPPASIESWGDAIVLDGSSSYDRDTWDTPSYTWTFVSGPSNSALNQSALSNIDAHGMKAKFNPDVLGEYTFNLTVADTCTSSSSQMVVTVVADCDTQNTIPTAQSGGNQEVEVSTDLVVTLNGSATVDVDVFDAIDYQWEILSWPSGSSQPSVESNTSVVATFQPDKAGIYKLSLTVSDTCGSNEDLFDVVVSVNCQETNTAPTAAVVVANSTVTIGTEVSFDGSGSSDADTFDVPHYSWSVKSKPSASEVTTRSLSGRGDTLMKFTPDAVGDFEVTLTVGDTCTTVTANSTITVAPDCAAGNTAPVANAGSAVEVSAGQNVTIDISHSHDPDAPKDEVAWSTVSWSLVSGPSTEGVVSAVSDAKWEFSLPILGEYTYQLYLEDLCGSNSTDEVTIVVTADCSTNNLPVPNPTQSAAEGIAGNPVTLDASLSSDADAYESGLTYAWSIVTTPSGSGVSTTAIANASSVTASFTPDLAGSYEVRVTVSDSCGSQEIDANNDASLIEIVVSEAATVLSADRHGRHHQMTRSTGVGSVGVALDESSTRTRTITTMDAVTNFVQDNVAGVLVGVCSVLILVAGATIALRRKRSAVNSMGERLAPASSLPM